MSNQNQTETPARRGRPSAFPGVETKAFMTNIPLTSIDMVREIAAAKELTLAQAIDLCIGRVHRDVTRQRSKKTAG